MGLLRFTSCQAENAELFCKALARHVGARLGVPTAFVDDVPWQERDRLLDRGQIHVAWICGLPYVEKADRTACGIELLAAPVMKGARYRGRPIYFSDIVVARESSFRTFQQLRGTRWAYNEPRAHSGYNIVREHLAELGENRYFGEVLVSRKGPPTNGLPRGCS